MKRSCQAALLALATDTIRACTFQKRVSYFGREETADVLLPSGDEKYLSFWVRDAAMMAESGLLSDDALLRYIGIIACHGQNGEGTRHLANGLTVPPYAVADHINYDAHPVFFPGTYSSGEDQGKGDYGFYPPFCDNFWFILMVAQYVKGTGDTAPLTAEYAGMPLATRLLRAFFGYGIDPASGLCVSEEERYTVDWGFVDTVKKSGKLLTSSLFRYRAGVALGGMLAAVGMVAEGEACRHEAEKIKEAILPTFYDAESGWLLSATGIGRQPDVWGTAYAVFCGLPVGALTMQALADGYRKGTAVKDGYVRHIPLCPKEPPTVWEASRTPSGTYQNGAYWATATGWYAYALYKGGYGTEILEDFLAHTARHAAAGAPFEWIDERTERVSGLHYGTSGVLPYVGLCRILDEAAGDGMTDNEN